MPWGCLRFVIVVFPEHTILTYYLELIKCFSRWSRSIQLVLNMNLSAPATYQNNYDFDVILGDCYPFTTQGSDHFRMCSNIMMAPDIAPLNVQNMFNRYQARSSSCPR